MDESGSTKRGRRGANEGSVYRRKSDGLWCGAVHVGYDQQGKRIRRVFTGKSRAEVVQKLGEAQRRVQQGLPVPSDRLTVAQYLELWLRDSASQRLRESSLTQYAGSVERYLKPSLGRHRLSKLEPHHVAALYGHMLRELKLAPSTVLYTHRVLHRALDQAERWGYIARNVAELVDPPALKRPEIKAFNIDQAKDFLKAVRGDALEALYVLALATGLRRGELLALRWEDIDTNRGTLAVRRSMTKVQGGWAIGEPKTASSRRVVRLPAFALEALEAHRERRPVTPLPTAFVFATAAGKPIDGRHVLRKFKERLAAAKLPDFTFHSLRHSAATLLLALDVPPKVVMEVLGHSRSGITLDVYSHVLPDLQADAAQRMHTLLGAPAAEPAS